MMTLKEFITKVNDYEHYRVYQPNRDCLIFESYFKVHSPYYFDDAHEEAREFYNHDYYDNNDYCDNVRHPGMYDEETLIFLEKFGDYIVFRMEISGVRPCKMYKDEKGELKFEYIDLNSVGNRDYLDCYNLFILPANAIKEDE